MKIQELRIGNLVKCKTSNDSAIYSVIQIDGFGLKVRLSHPRHTEFTPIDRIKPISLTEEVLLKCGFEKIENNWKVLNFFFCQLNWERLAGMTLAIEDVSIYIPHIKYLHQLQNLYFDLTGEELEVKL